MKHRYILLQLTALFIITMPFSLLSQGISDCYSQSSVKAGKASAGFISRLNDGSVVTNSYSTGLIRSEDLESAGGFIASANGNTVVSNSYWDINTSNIQESVLGSGRTTSHMTYPHNTNSYVSWDFINLWSRDINHLNKGYPYHQSRLPDLHFLSILNQQTDLGTVNNGNRYSYGATVFANAYPDPGIMFLNWTNASGVVVSTESSFEFYMPNEDHQIEAHFDYIDYTVQVDVQPENSGTVTGTGIYHINDNVGLLAIPNADYKFVNYTDDLGNIIHESADYNFEIATSDVYLTANFKLSTSTDEISNENISVYPNPFLEYLNIESAGDYSVVKIYNNQASLIETIINNDKTRLTTVHYPKGIYTIIFLNSEGQEITRRIIKL